MGLALTGGAGARASPGTRGRGQAPALGRRAPDVTPHENPDVAQQAKDDTQKSLLALRDPAKKSHELTPETVDLSLPRAADGEVAQPRPPVRGANSDPSRQKNGERVKLALSDKDFEYLFGAEAEAERRLAQTERYARVIGYAIDARRQRFPHETPFVYQPHAAAARSFRWDAAAKASMKDYNLLDLSI